MAVKFRFMNEWIKGAKTIARVMSVAPRTVYNMRSEGKLEWFEAGKLMTMVASAENWRDWIRPRTKEAAAEARGKAGAAAVGRDPRGRFTDVSSGTPWSATKRS